MSSISLKTQPQHFWGIWLNVENDVRCRFNGIAGNGSCNVQLLQILVPDYWIKVLS